MKNHELLVPVGNMECLKQAVFNGCDAVYLACKEFGARKFALNFTNEEIVKAIKFCHLYGVKVFVTMNTLVKNSEVDYFLEQALFLHENGVDALIVQDFGMICLLRKKFPNLEIHASTQANVCCSEVCKLYYDLGVKRVVFARELSIDEIDSIDVPIEKEAFIHGALCISYSGCCLMSSMLGGRSGNRGECAGCCRMPFNLKHNGNIISEGKYLLSTKELNTSSEINRLLNSSIYSFKIEGRMKSPLYVGFVTRFYRKLIDGEDINLDNEIEKLKTIFNREFTKGRLFDTDDLSLMNTKSPNHIGLRIGKVAGFEKGKIKIQLDDGYTLNQYDAIRFLNSQKGCVVNFLYDKKDNLINSSSDICYIDNKVELNVNDIVCKTQDYFLGKEFENIKEKKVPVTFNVTIEDNELKVVLSDIDNSITEYYDVLEKAIKAPITNEDIIKQFSKLGNTPFECINCDINISNDVFIPLRVLNDIRRELVDRLINVRENKKTEVVISDVDFIRDNNSYPIGKTCFVNDKKLLDKCLESDYLRIYVSNYDLYKEYEQYDNVYYAIPRCSYNRPNINKGLIYDYGDYSNKDYYGSYSLNVFNVYTAYYLKQIGLKNIPISVELSEDEIDEFINKYREMFGNCEFELLVSGRIENMIIKGNILNINVNDYGYELIDFKNRKFPVYYDGTNTHILNYELRTINKDLFINKCSIRYDFYNGDK